MTWRHILEQWNRLELDLHDKRIDCESGILRRRTWRWLQLHILDIVERDTTRLHRALFPPPERSNTNAS